MLHAWEDSTLGGPIGSELIRHDDPGHVAQSLQQLVKEALGRLRVAAALNQDIEHVGSVAALKLGLPELRQEGGE